MDFGFKPIKLPTYKIPSVRKSLLRKRDIARQINPSKRVREPIPAKKKNALKKRAKNKCEWPKCKEREGLEVHHLNMKNDDNNLSNLKLFCPNHHSEWHRQNKKISERDLIGRELKSKIVKKEKYKEEKKKMQERNSLIPKFDLWGK